jgi:DNA-binding transcriptional LysR family regulator
VGVDLLVRGVRQVKPTLQGQMLYDYAKKIIYLSQQAQVAIQSIGEEVKGYIRVGTLNSLGMYLITPVVGMFLKNNSQLRIKLVFGSGNELLKLMESGELDVAVLPEGISEFRFEPENCEKRFLMRDDMLLVASGKDMGIPRKVSFKQFSERPSVLLLQEYPEFTAVLDKVMKDNDTQLNPVFEASNVGTVKRAIESGLGWGFLPAHSIQKQVRTGRLKKIELDEMTYSREVYYYVRRDVMDLPSVEVFYRAIQQQVNP